MNRIVLTRCWACAIFFLAVSAPAGAKGQPGGRIATLTILEGPLQLIRGANKLAAAEGVALESDDILETQAGTAHARVETADGLVLDLGPSTRVLLGPTKGSPWRAYVLEGWAKLSAARPYTQAGTPIIATPVLDLSTFDTEAVLRVAGPAAEVFAPSGPAVLNVKARDGKPLVTRLERGKHIARQADGAAKVGGLPPPAFVQAMPVPFRDTLPSRLAAFKDKSVKLPAPTRLVYADVAHWLNAEPRLRVLFIPRLRALVRDEAFRKPLAEQMSLHPEWHPILYPPVSAPAPQSGKAPMSYEAP